MGRDGRASWDLKQASVVTRMKASGEGSFSAQHSTDHLQGHCWSRQVDVHQLDQTELDSSAHAGDDGTCLAGQQLPAHILRSWQLHRKGHAGQSQCAMWGILLAVEAF